MGVLGLNPVPCVTLFPLNIQPSFYFFFNIYALVCVCECMCVCVCVCLCMWMLAAILALQTQNFRLELASSHTGGAILPWNKGRKAS